MVKAVSLPMAPGATSTTAANRVQAGGDFKSTMAAALQEDTPAGTAAGVSTPSAATVLGSIGANGLFATPEEERAFSAELTGRLAAAGVDTSSPIHLTVDAQGKVVAKAGTPGKATIDATFAADPALSNTYRKIANTEVTKAIVQETQKVQSAAAHASASEQSTLWQTCSQVIDAIKAVGSDLTLDGGTLVSASMEVVLRQSQG